MVHQLIREQFLRITIEEAWAFFSSPANLNVITPSGVHFRITCEMPAEIREGLIITYKVSPFLRIPLNWHTQILEVEKPFKFSDRQIKGPYKFWHHEHQFKAVDGGVIVKDIVQYDIGKGVIGTIAGWLFVHRQVRNIFRFRKAKLEQLFPSNS